MNIGSTILLCYGTPVGARKGWDTRGFALEDTLGGRDGKEALVRNGFIPGRYGETHVDDALPAMEGRNYEAFGHPSGAYAVVIHDPASGNMMTVKGNPALLDSVDTALKTRVHV